jgi:hypothetical protein
MSLTNLQFIINRSVEQENVTKINYFLYRQTSSLLINYVYLTSASFRHTPFTRQYLYS